MTDASRIPIWPTAGADPTAIAEQEMVLDGDRMVRNVTLPSLDIFHPEAPPTGTAVVIAPGGAFHFLMTDYEGDDLARWLALRGVAAFVLRHRLVATPHPDVEAVLFHRRLVADLQASSQEVDILARFGAEGRAAIELGAEDVRRSIQLVREQSAVWRIDPRSVGIVGFSAGGTLALMAALSDDDSSRPDFAAPIYPGVPAEIAVTPDAPPLFIVVAQDDELIPASSSVRLWEAWRTAGRDAEIHVFRDGGHGFGMKRLGLTSDAWPDLFGAWLTSLGLLKQGAISRPT